MAYDYVIVGAGSAGCVLASRPGESPDASIAVIEAGPPDTDPEIHVPFAFGQLLKSHGWGYDDVLPYFKRAEDNERGESTYHGVGGPLTVSDSRSMHPLIDAMIAAAVEAGIPAPRPLSPRPMSHL